MPELELCFEELEELKRIIVHSDVGWDEEGKAEEGTTMLLKAIDRALGETGVDKEGYGYHRLLNVSFGRE